MKSNVIFPADFQTHPEKYMRILHPDGTKECIKCHEIFREVKWKRSGITYSKSVCSCNKS